MQNGRQLSVAFIPPGGNQPLVVERLQPWGALPEHLVEAGPPALDAQPSPPVQGDAADNLLGPQLPKSRQLETGEDQAPAGGHIQELQGV